jgi:hypothetical protein
MPSQQLARVDARDGTVFHHPATLNHDAVGAMGAAQNQRRQRVAVTGEAEFVELEKGNIRHLTGGDRTEIASPDAGG